MDVKIEFLSAKTLDQMTSEKKLASIIAVVTKEKNCILVLETPLTREEEKNLIARTMSSVSKSFPGIEIASLGKESSDLRTELIKFLGGKTTGLTVVGPSTLVKKVKRDPNKLSLFTGK